MTLPCHIEGKARNISSTLSFEILRAKALSMTSGWDTSLRSVWHKDVLVWQGNGSVWHYLVILSLHLVILSVAKNLIAKNLDSLKSLKQKTRRKNEKFNKKPKGEKMNLSSLFTNLNNKAEKNNALILLEKRF